MCCQWWAEWGKENYIVGGDFTGDSLPYSQNSASPYIEMFIFQNVQAPGGS